MLSVSEARERILSVFQPVEKETIPLDRCAGRVLAENIFASTDLPLFDNSSVDGFALITAELDSTPKVLRVVADIRAGNSNSICIRSGECARIMTGAALPSGADAVVMVEDTDFQERNPGSPAPAQVSIHKKPHPGENIRRRGDDVVKGDLTLQGSLRLRAQELGLLATLGVSRVSVYRQPRLALLSSGDELLPPEAPLQPGKVRDANTSVLAALAQEAGMEILPLGVAADDEKDTRSRLMQALDGKADVILSSAGVSVGAYDYIKPVVESEGELQFWRVNMRPGKPLAFGKFHGIPFFGLPGNPVSAFVGFKVFVLPALQRLSGMSLQPRALWKAKLVQEIETDGRESYLRAVVSEEEGVLVARLTGHQGSGNIFSLVQANALLIVPSGVKCVPANTEVEVWPLE